AARGRAIGIFELSWALALCVGGPVVALLINWVGWRGPFAALAIASTVALVGVAVLLPADVTTPRRPPGVRRRQHPVGEGLPGSAWPPLLASALTAAAGLGLFVVSGAWL